MKSPTHALELLLEPQLKLMNQKGQPNSNQLKLTQVKEYAQTFDFNPEIVDNLGFFASNLTWHVTIIERTFELFGT